MGTNEVALLRAQAGLEASPGVAVAASRVIYAAVDPTYARPLGNVPDRSGTYHPRRKPNYARPTIGHGLTDVVTFEDLVFWAQMFLKGGVVGVSDAGTPPAYVWTFVPSMSIDDLKSMTLEFNEAGNPYESNQVYVNSATLRFNPDNANEPTWMLDLECSGRNWIPTTYTAALPDRLTEGIPAPGTNVYIVDAVADLAGASPITGRLISGSITFTVNRHQKAFSEDKLAAALGKTGRGDYLVDAQIVTEFDSDTEFAHYRAAIAKERVIRFESEGSVIHDAITKRMQLDVAGFYNAWSRSDREGNLIATMGVAGFVNSSLAAEARLAVRNSLATL